MERNLSGDREPWSLAATLVDEQRRRVQSLRAASHSTAQAEALLSTFECSLDAIIGRYRSAGARNRAFCFTCTREEPALRRDGSLVDSADQVDVVLQVQEAVDRERKEIAQALHDELGQQLAAMKIQLGELDCALQVRHREHVPAPAMLDLQSRIEAAIFAVRRVAFNLRPMPLDEMALGAAIEALASEYRCRSGLAVRCQVRVKTETFGEEAATSIYRIVQEALTNITRHARATHASIELYRFRSTYILRIQDDGIGALPDALFPASALGLRGMRERVRRLDGRMRLDTTPGHGFIIAIRLPEKSLVPLVQP
ncbi:sensor histidine kinase [Paraburkholderia lycopersici]|uniref:Histidine kinase-, DNA gyrase B-, and HSP90-like ATPase n=1 Tax=Paraburkholderia lycopersici TaxID=416944 RepID=A0A1G7CXE0_9BURK|nr:sensor histidine kinase [Paraburkholderia lycopersici]SDE43967.1 Histidine kinase-, DNA gyrase B-, and HSP90-like ATPase [Paraburkholderia lycopersici]